MTTPKSLYSSHPWYHTTLWRRLRLNQLNREPLCYICLRSGKERPATIVDHHKPFVDSWDLFVDPSNHRSVCKLCHDSAKRIQQNKGIMPGCGADGLPLDPNHSWGVK